MVEQYWDPSAGGPSWKAQSVGVFSSGRMLMRSSYSASSSIVPSGMRARHSRRELKTT